MKEKSSLVDHGAKTAAESEEQITTSSVTLPAGNKTIAFVSMVALGLLSGCTEEKNQPTSSNGKKVEQDPSPVGVYAAPVAIDITYQVGGKIIDQSSQPVANVVVSLLDTNTYTDANGEWSFNFKEADCVPTSNCSVTLTPSLSSGLSAQTNQLVDADTSEAKFVSLGNVYKLEANTEPVAEYAAPMVGDLSYQTGGKVVDAITGLPVAGITVTVLGTTATTDETGAWTIAMSASDCSISDSCTITVKPAASSKYGEKTIPMVSSTAEHGKFISLDNVIRLADRENETIGVYAAPATL